jgi:hypothetical protein
MAQLALDRGQWTVDSGHLIALHHYDHYSGAEKWKTRAESAAVFFWLTGKERERERQSVNDDDLIEITTTSKSQGLSIEKVKQQVRRVSSRELVHHCHSSYAQNSRSPGVHDDGNLEATTPSFLYLLGSYLASMHASIPSFSLFATGIMPAENEREEAKEREILVSITNNHHTYPLLTPTVSSLGLGLTNRGVCVAKPRNEPVFWKFLKRSWE